MKRILVLFFGAGILLGCNSNVANHEEASPHANDTFQVEAQKNKELSLNNEIKWNSDESTNENVKELKTIIDNFNQEKETEISGYKMLATNLQNSLNKLIKECRMKGPDHDALHLWLEPVLKDVNSLNGATSSEEAAELFNSIYKKVNVYDQYFE